MKIPLTPPEKGLIAAAFIFACLSIMAIAASWLGTWVSASRVVYPEQGGAAFAVSFGIMMVVFGMFSCAASMIMLVVNIVWNKRALRSVLGLITYIFNVIVLMYAGFAALLIFSSWKP